MSGRNGNAEGALPHPSSGQEFPTTRWSLIERTQCADGAPVAAGRTAMGMVLTRYLPPLRAHLLRRGIAADRVDDLLQGFIADKVLERDLLATADRERGRFRSFLITALNNYAANQLRAN